MSHSWTPEQIPSQDGRRALITGANSGIGFEAAKALAKKGAEVIVAARSAKRGQRAVEQIRQETGGASVAWMLLDLADLTSVRRFAEAFRARYSHLDLLINNAGVMAIPYLQTAQGFEMQFGVNHLGHFALTGLLLDLIVKTPQSRVVTVSSAMHEAGWMRFDRLDGRNGYNRWLAYGQSKLANLLFAFELQRRLAAAGAPTISAACHPGWAATNLQYAAVRMQQQTLLERVIRFWNTGLAQPAASGAWPTLFAATSPAVNGCDYIGPRFGMRGSPVKQRANRRAYDEKTAKKLWDVSEELTGVDISLPTGVG